MRPGLSRRAGGLLLLALLLGCTEGTPGSRVPATGARALDGVKAGNTKEARDVAQADVVLRVESVEKTGEGLALAYAVRNQGSRPIWVFNRLFHVTDSGTYRLDPNVIYVEVEGGQVVLSKQLQPVPRTSLVESPEVPGVTRLPPGEVLAERVVVPLPLRESHPYVKKPDVLPLSEVRELRLRVGYLPDAPGLKLREGEDTQGLRFQLPSYGPAKEAQVVLDSGPLPVPSAGK